MGKKKRVPTYEEYKNIKDWFHCYDMGDKEGWETLTDEKRIYYYKDKKTDACLSKCITVFFIVFVVGGMAGYIIYHIHIDDILNGILLALGFPIFIIAGFFGAGKGI